MKKLFSYLLTAMLIFAVGCSEAFDDSALWNEINSLKGRVDALEQLCNQMNTNISALQTIVEALQKNDYVTNIAPITEGGVVIGYTISFSKSDSITIYHGKDGKDGQNGADGKDGKDGHTPQIGVKEDADGLYYWTLDGEWLLDNDGNKIKAQGKDGKDGEDGADGKDGENGADSLIPQLKIEDGYWYVSYDNGTTWTEVGKATGEDGDSMFDEITYDEHYVYITLADGFKFTLPRHNISSNKIYYTSSDGEVVEPYLRYSSIEELFGANILSNVYENGQGVITFDGNVITIGDYAFSGCSSLESITIPSGVTTIGSSAFISCSSLESITIPNSVITIGDFAFSGCSSLTSITIPDSVTTIDDYAFGGCSSLESITIPSGVTTIGDSAFGDCLSLESITIPDSVTSIGNYPFSVCTSLTAFYGKYASADNRCLIVDGELKSFAPAGLTSYTIPNGVTSVGPYAFSRCSSLESITIPSGVTTIGDNVFYNCSSLTSITIPDSVTNIGNYPFSGCTSLTAFYGKYASADNRCLIVDGELKFFIPAGLTSYTIPNGVTSIVPSAFSGCSSLESITIPNGVTTIGSSAFYRCSSLESITIPDSVTNIGNYPFSGCTSLTAFYGKYASADNRCLIVDGKLINFAPAGLTSYTIPDGVTAIAPIAFMECESLESITIPESVTSIYYDAFRDCSSLTTVYSKSTTPPIIDGIGGGLYYEVPSLSKIYVPMASVDTYKYVWSSNASIIEGYTF